MTILAVDDLGKGFQLHARGAAIQAVVGCSFSCAGGTITALSGPSGAGKSTVLKCIFRTYLPSTGTIQLHRADGTVIDLAAADERQVLEIRQQEMGFVTQFLHCLPRRSALDVVGEPLWQTGISRADARDRAAELLRRLGLPETLWSLPPSTFSGGEQQRVNIARGFINLPRLLLLDEPTASLDPATAERVIELIGQARTDGCAILGIWHDPRIVERLADQTVAIQVEQAVAQQ